MSKFNETIYWYNKFSAGIDDIIHLDCAGVTHPDKEYLIKRPNGFNHMFVLEYVVSGKGYIESLGQIKSVSAGDFYLVNCKTPHKYYSDPDEPYEKKWINVSGHFMTGIVKAFFIEESAFAVKLYEPCDKIFDEIHNKIKNTTVKNSEEMTSFLMKKILDVFLLVESVRHTEANALEPAEKIARYIDKNICLDLNVTEICKVFYISSSTLYRIFKTRFSMSPKNYIMMKKVEAARNMIRYENAPSSIVATSLNFYDARHFLTVFKSYTGFSPSEYRAKIKAEMNGQKD